VSATVTENSIELTLPAESVVEQMTIVSPIANTVPLTG